MRPPPSITARKHLLTGTALAAALALATPAWAQAAPAATAPPSAPGATSATPPMHRHMRHVPHAATHHKMAPGAGSTANQLNQQELARLQTGAPPPPAPSMPSAQMQGAPAQMQGGNSMGMPGPAAGGPGLTPYSTGIPPQR